MKARVAKIVVAAGSLLAGCLVFLSVASAGGTGARQTIPLLNVGLAGTVPTLDMTRNAAGYLFIGLGLETVMKYRPDGSVQPNLAESVTRPGRAVYVYHLRKGIKFWNGNELTAADVANAWNYYRYPGALTAFGYASVKSIVATSRYAVAVTLRRPDASWQFVPASYSSGVFEKKFQDAHKTTFGQPGVLVMGTGPWKFDRLTTTGAELSANPHWWGGKVPVQRVSIKFLADENAAALALRAGEIDIDAYVNDPRTFARTSGVLPLRTPSCQQGFFTMNTKAAPWNDVHVRRAIAYALNRADLIQATGGYASPNYTFIPTPMLRTIASQDEINKLLASLPLYKFDLAKARAELARSAYPKGFSTTIRTFSGGYGVNPSQVIAAGLAKIGINAEVREADAGAFFGSLAGATDARPSVFLIAGCPSPDPSAFPSLFLGSKRARPGGFNTAVYAPPAVDGLLTAGLATSVSAKRLATYSQLLRRLATDVPYVPLLVTDITIGVSKRFAYPGFNQYYSNGPWLLNIRPR